MPSTRNELELKKTGIESQIDNHLDEWELKRSPLVLQISELRSDVQELKNLAETGEIDEDIQKAEEVHDRIQSIKDSLLLKAEELTLLSQKLREVDREATLQLHELSAQKAMCESELNTLNENPTPDPHPSLPASQNHDSANLNTTALAPSRSNVQPRVNNQIISAPSQVSLNSNDGINLITELPKKTRDY